MNSRKRICLAVAMLLSAAILAAAEDLPVLIAMPDSLNFRATTSAAQTANVSISVSRNGPALAAFTASASTTSGGNWLSVSPQTGSGATTLKVTAAPGTLKPGEYSGSVAVSATGFRAVTVKAKLLIMGANERGGDGEKPASALIVRPDDLEFRAVEGGEAPRSREVAVFNPAGDSFTWTAKAATSSPPQGGWLSITPASGTGKGSINVSVDPKGLRQGSYKGQVTVTSGTNTATVNVEFEINAPREANLVIDPRAFNFIVDSTTTLPLAAKTLNVKNAGGGTLSWTAAATVNTPSGSRWLSISPSSGTTPGTISVKADPKTGSGSTLLPAGMYSGKVTVTAGTAKAEAQVFLRIVGPDKPRVTVTPKALNFTSTGNTVTPASRDIRIDSKATGLSYTAKPSTAKGGNWLSITPPSGTVPGTVKASVVASAVPATAGVYTGSIEIKVSGASQEVNNVLVALRVGGAGDTPELEVEPGAVAFRTTVGGSNPADQKVTLQAEGAASIAWTATVTVASPPGGTWLRVTPTTGTATAGTPSQVTIQASAGLGVGLYSGTVVFTPPSTSGASPAHLTVKLVVSATTGAAPVGTMSVESAITDGQAAVASGPLVAFFSGPPDGFINQVNLPLNVSVTVLDANGAPVEGASVVVDSSNTEPDLVLTEVGSGLYTGVFRALSGGTLRLAGSAQLGTQAASTFVVSGNMVSTGVAPTVVFQDGAVSAASFAASPTPLAPGSLLSLFGLGIAGAGGSASGVPLPTTLGNVSVTIGGVAAPLLSGTPGATQDQINLQVPFELNGLAQADVVVNNNGVLTTAETINIGTAPAVFTTSSTGLGAGAILHGADFSLVGTGRPAKAGEMILIYATGLGVVQPAVASGSAASGEAKVAASVAVTIGGVSATVQFAGLAPGFVGLYQINVVVPAGAGTGNVSVVVSTDGTPATGQATIALQ